ncbi:MAG: aldehyde ferredoxin oxidoreductase [Thermoproteota archaeon]|nr:MAG: aldehyde ferredoxin oxidoreductase [Candidatus Korarchaeota archaeon]
MVGFDGRVIVVDLEKGSIKRVFADKHHLNLFLGGRGCASFLLYQMVKRGMDPFSADNPLIFGVGPFTGAIWPSSSRFVVVAKSPATEGLGYANAGGFFGPYMRFAGVDFLILKGRANRPVFILVCDGRIEIRSAVDLWGKPVYETEQVLKDEVGGRRVSVACIGPAGERMVRFASIICDEGRVAARAGMGAVMGSKLVKGIVVSGEGRVEPKNPEKFEKVSKEAFSKVVENPILRGYREYGTSIIILPKNDIGDLPTKNHYDGTFRNAHNISAERIHRLLGIVPSSCFSCPIGCGRKVRLKLNGEKVFEGMEYETIASLGSNCGNSDARSIAEMNYMCNDLGLDTISTGVVIAWAMECYEKGLLTKEDTGIELEWGNAEAMKEIIRQIAFRKGFGDILAEGVKRASQKVGRGTERYAMHVKGLEIPMQQPRTVKMFALGHATSNRGADHLYALPTICYPWLREIAKEWLGLSDEELDQLNDLDSWKQKAKAVVFSENLCAVADSLGLCKFPLIESYALPLSTLVKGYNALVGSNLTPIDLLKAGERIVNLERMFNVREGFSKKDDSLPERFLVDPMPSGSSKGSVVELGKMLEEYYKIRGWDPASGVPKDENIRELGLKFD